MNAVIFGRCRVSLFAADLLFTQYIVCLCLVSMDDIVLHINIDGFYCAVLTQFE